MNLSYKRFHEMLSRISIAWPECTKTAIGQGPAADLGGGAYKASKLPEVT
jgi:hypothetical protein